MSVLLHFSGKEPFVLTAGGRPIPIIPEGSKAVYQQIPFRRRDADGEVTGLSWGFKEEADQEPSDGLVELDSESYKILLSGKYRKCYTKDTMVDARVHHKRSIDQMRAEKAQLAKELAEMRDASKPATAVKSKK